MADPSLREICVRALRDTRTSLATWGFGVRALALGVVSLSLLFLLEGWPAVIAQWPKFLAATIIPVVGIGLIYLVLHFIRAPTYIAREDNQKLEHELRDAQSELARLRQVVAGERDTAADIRLRLISRGLDVIWNADKQPSLITQEFLFPFQNEERKLGDAIMLGLLNIGHKNARDITISGDLCALICPMSFNARKSWIVINPGSISTSSLYRSLLFP
jgi:hypothetical protein